MILNAISLSFIATNTIRQFNTGTTQSQGIDISAINNDTIKLLGSQHPYEDSWIQLGDHLTFGDDRLIVELIEFDIRKSEGTDFELIQENHSRGKDLEEAKELAIGIQFQVEQQAPNSITVPNALQISQGEKWRNQQVKLILKVPVGHSLYIDERLGLHDVDLDDRRVNPWRERGKIWRMETTGLVCTNCDNLENEQKLQFSDFNKLKIDGKLKVQIDRGDEFKVSLNGKPHYVERVDVVNLDSTLNISAKLDGASSPVRLYITMPYLQDIQIEGTDDLSLRGFQQPKLSINHQGGDEVKAYIEVDTLIVRQTERSKLDLYGRCQYLDADLREKSKLDAEKATLKKVSVNANESSRAFFPLLSEEEITIQKDESSTIKIEGKTIEK